MVHQRSQHLRFATLTCLALFFSAGLQADDEPIAVYSAGSPDKDEPVAPYSVAVVDGKFGERSTMVLDGGSRL